MSDLPQHDPAVNPGPRIRVRVLLALLRVAAGRRGHARLTWWGQAFRYTVRVERVSPSTYHLDADPTALGLADVRQTIRAAIEDDTP